MPNEISNRRNDKKIFDLEERTAKFSEDVIEFCKNIQQTTITTPIINQLIKAATSIGANYCEADCAETKKDFEHKLGICKKESKETKYWLRIVTKATPEVKNQSRKLWQEANELNLIFSTIIKKSRSK